MSHQGITEAVDSSIEFICSEFRSHPTRFFTENDIVCRFYSVLQQKLSTSNSKTRRDKDGCEHFLVHREYPTPFRCDMGKGKFEVKEDDARTPEGGKYEHGHYDIVVLNPDFIKQHSYEVIKAQDYELYKAQVRSTSVILYGVEFMYSRDPLKGKGINAFIVRVKQDADKLIVSKDKGFMDRVKMLTFVKGGSKEICSLLTEELSGRNEIVLCFSD